MKRDGASTSIWQKDIPDYKSKGLISENPPYDVVVVGGGITGISTGLLLQRAGKSVMIAEAENICFGTTGGTTAHLNTFLDCYYDKVIDNFGEENARLLARGVRMSLDLVEKNVKEFAIDCWHKELPGYLFAQDSGQNETLDKIYEASIRAGVEVQYSPTTPMPIPFSKAIEFGRQAQFHPVHYVYCLAKQFEKAGGILIENCRITGVEEDELVRISSTLGPINARALIYATHIPPGLNLLHFRCTAYRSYVLGVKLKNSKDYPIGMAYDLQHPYHYFRTQELEGEKFLIAGGEDHKTGHEKNTEECFTRLENYIRKYYEVDSIPFRWSSQYFESADGLPYIGHLPGHPGNIYVATGYGGDGISYSGLAATLLTEMIVAGKSEYEKLFDPSRIKAVAGFSNFIKEAADVSTQMIRGIFPKDKLEELAELPPGEAKVIKYEGQSIALYKDEKGNLHAVDPACTHIKCTVNWNAAEKSWDCPCHGSRFSFDGDVLTAPARKKLAVVELKELVEK